MLDSELRATRTSQDFLLAMLIAGSLLLAVPVGHAQEAESPAPVATEEARDAPPASDTENEEPAASESIPAGDSVGGQMGEVTLEKFIPSEEISADGAVSFPVDI